MVTHPSTNQVHGCLPSVINCHILPISPKGLANFGQPSRHVLLVLLRYSTRDGLQHLCAVTHIPSTAKSIFQFKGIELKSKANEFGLLINGIAVQFPLETSNCPQIVTHPTTNPVCGCLTSVVKCHILPMFTTGLAHLDRWK